MFTLDERCVRRQFAHAAPSYAGAARLAQEVNQRLGEHLLGLQVYPQTLLDLGCGTGFAQDILRVHCPKAQHYALDVALPMLHRISDHRSLWTRLRGHKEIALVCADMHQLPFAEASLDMVWSCLAMQWATHLPQVCAEVYRVLKPGGLLICATLGPDTFHEIRWAFDGVDEYQHTSAFLDPRDFAQLLLEQGLQSPVLDIDHICLRYPSLSALFKELRDSGVTNAAQRRRPGLMGKAAWKSICLRYESLVEEGRYPLSYEVVYAHAWKPLISPKSFSDAHVQPLVFHPRGD